MATATLYLDTHWRVPAHVVDHEKVAADLLIQDQAALRSRQFGGFRVQREAIALWELQGDYLVLPRGYDVPLRPGVEADVRDLRPAFDTVRGWGFHRSFRPHQHAPAKALIDNVGRDKLLCLGCGKGKTTLALWYASQLAVKTLVIVDRDFLLEQWKREIKKCLWKRREDIGHVQGDPENDGIFRIGEQITVAMVHTLAQFNFDESFYKRFGLVIFDEAHVAAAPTFSRVLPRFIGERLILTATPERADGLHPVFLYHAGGLEPVYVDISRDQSSEWYFRRIPKMLTDDELHSCMRRIPGRYKREWDPRKRRTVQVPMTALQRPKYDTLLASKDEYNRLILREVNRAAAAGRNVLILGSRVEQLRSLAEASRAAGFDASCVTSKVKGDKRLEAFKHQVLYITNSIGNKALDIDRLDTLILLAPVKDEGWLRQAVGRIDRELAGKHRPIVVIFHHTGVDSMERSSRDMMEAIRSIDRNATIRYV